MFTASVIFATTMFYASIVAYFLVRILWIKNFSTILLMRSPAIYNNLPDWKFMVWVKFWVWNETKFLPDPDALRKA